MLNLWRKFWAWDDSKKQCFTQAQIGAWIIFGVVMGFLFVVGSIYSSYVR